MCECVRVSVCVCVSECACACANVSVRACVRDLCLCANNEDVYFLLNNLLLKLKCIKRLNIFNYVCKIKCRFVGFNEKEFNLLVELRKYIVYNYC